MTSKPTVDSERSVAAIRAGEALYARAKALIAQDMPEEAAAPLLAAAEAGHAGAQVELARMFLYGVGTPLDVTQAIDWLHTAERSQHPGASYLLALVGLGGIALERDLEAVSRRLLFAGSAGLVPALRALAMHFGRHRDNVRAMRQSESWLAQAALQGDGVSAALLAERIRHGELVGDAQYALASLDALAAKTGITAMPSLPGVPVVAGGGGRLELDLASSLRAPAFVTACQAPRVAMAEGLLSNEECRYIIAMGMPHLHPSQVVDPATGGWLQHPVRSSDDMSFATLLEDFQLRLLQLRMAAAIGIDFTCAEPMVLLHYRPGQRYLPHRDYLAPETLAANQPEAGQRVATLCCYLNSVEAGGETYFPVPDRVVTPSPGRAVAIRNLDDTGRPDPDTTHAGLPVQAGEKWLATLWLRERRYRDF